jgi:hypothetical protein
VPHSNARYFNQLLRIELPSTCHDFSKRFRIAARRLLFSSAEEVRTADRREIVWFVLGIASRNGPN